jgi:pyruvate dehydrogenase complex dehydrogenase (E1) component
MATGRILTDQDITELMLESDTHSWEDEDISAQRGGGTDSDTADANFTQWTDSTHSPTVPVVHKFTGGSIGLQQTEVPHIIKDFYTEHFQACLF